MEYRERNPLPECCKNCPEVSIEICIHCQYFQEKYEITDFDYYAEQTRRRLLRKLLHVECDHDYSILRWKKPNQRPVSLSYVLVKEYSEEFGTISCLASYEKEKFWYINGIEPDPIDETNILGWDYLPYDDHPDEEIEKLMDVFFSELRDIIQKEQDEMEGTNSDS